MKNIIVTENLSKEYGDVKVVTSLNLNVGKGEIYGFLGLNGAGKTTTIRMLLGMIKPTKGKAFITGQRVQANNNRLWKKIGYLVEIPYSYPNLTVVENLEIIRRLRFLKDKNCIPKVMETLELTAYRNRKVKHLSLGNKQRLGLAKALIHNPEILILDEPTNGMDPAGIHDIREFLSELANNQGVTIFISSHILGEISRFATRIGIIHQGKMVEEIDTTQLATLCQKHLAIKVKNTEKAYVIIKQHKYKNLEIEDNTIKITDERAIRNPDVLATLLVNSGLPPTLLNVDEENLESYFLRTIKMNGGIKK